ncbi:hypothetical protein HAX54_004624 [Datura stramonium]|uniref:Uncharacterized protein n=1 Tax=Datura stramonium TaxID=4076 RepID=A0ABS8T8I4_DATST|nr:hypothetical protein [Datura stramonium]
MSRPLFQPLDKMLQVEEFGDLTTKDKHAPAFKWPKLTLGFNDPLPTVILGDVVASVMAERMSLHLQVAIKKAMKPVVDKLGSLYSRVDVLEVEVASIKEELNRWKEMTPPIDVDLNIPTEGPSPPNDWCIGYSPPKGVAARVVQVDDPPHNEVPRTMSRTMDDGRHDDPYRVALISSYHEARTLPDRWVMTSPNEPLVFPPDPLMSSTVDIASWHFS